MVLRPLFLEGFQTVRREGPRPIGLGRMRGELALRHIAGSSLDITEQGPANIHIFGSSIRPSFLN